MANVTGLITINGKQVIEVDAVPSASSGTAAPIGSLALYDSGAAGSLYVKAGAADTAWSEVPLTASAAAWLLAGNTLTGGAANTPNEFFGSNNDYDVVFKRNGAEQYRLQSGAFLIGLAATGGGRLQVEAAALGNEILKQTSPNGGSGAKVAHVTRQHKAQTTNATPAILAALTLAASTRTMAKYMVGCNQHGGAGGALGDGGNWIRTIDAKRLAAGGAVLNRVQTDFTSKDVAALSVDFAVATNDINLSVTGTATRNLAWSAHAEIMVISD